MQALSDGFKSYLSHIRHERGLSRRTCAVYTSWLHHFERWLAENGYEAPTLDAFCTPVLRRYLVSLSERGLRPRTVHSAFNPLKGVGVYFVEEGAIESNPVKDLHLPKKDAALRVLVSDKEIALLLEAAERQASERQVALSRGILAVLTYAGLRRQELLDLLVGDINLEQRSILVRCGKGSKSRMVYPCNECIQALSEWLAQRGICNHDWLWALDRNRRLHNQGLQSLIAQVKAIAGMKSATHILPHSIRHAFATRLLRNGASLRDIQAALGHTSIQTTMVYLHSDEESQRKTAELGSLEAVDRRTTGKESAGRFRRIALDPSTAHSRLSPKYR